MPEHIEVHAPHELTDVHADGPVSVREKQLELAAVFLLSIATLCIAWSGYQAAEWSGLQAREYAQAAAAHAAANQSSTLAGQERLQDLLNFNRWLEVSTQGNTELADIYVRRFRPEFKPAFVEWLKQDPLNNNNAIATPLLMPQYKIAAFTRATRLDAAGTVHFGRAKHATEQADSYVFGTLFFAAVLFFAGISMRFSWIPVRMSVMVGAALFLLYGIVHLASLSRR